MRTHNDPSAAAPPPIDERAAAPCPGDVPESFRLARQQMLVNEALVRKVFQRERLSMGVPELDAMLGGGLPVGYSLLLVGPSGSGKTILATEFLAQGARMGEKR